MAGAIPLTGKLHSVQGVGGKRLACLHVHMAASFVLVVVVFGREIEEKSSR